jgi:hypothetical protein
VRQTHFTEADEGDSTRQLPLRAENRSLYPEVICS